MPLRSRAFDGVSNVAGDPVNEVFYGDRRMPRAAPLYRHTGGNTLDACQDFPL